MPQELLPFERSSDTSREAALEQMRKPGKVATDRSRIYEAIRRHPDGLTDQELEKYTGIRPDTIRPRRGELAKVGLIEKSGKKRRTATGSLAAVWIAILLALPAAAQLSDDIVINSRCRAFYAQTRTAQCVETELLSRDEHYAILASVADRRIAANAVRRCAESHEWWSQIASCSARVWNRYVGSVIHR